MEDIDSDGNGTVSYDEFADWFIGGKEGTPVGVTSRVSNFLGSTT